MSNKMYDNITGRSPIATDDLGYIGTGQKASQIISSGTTNYNELTNKPSINNVELSGNKTSSDLGLQSELTEAQTNAVNSGITAALTEQITTNQNNISLINHAANTSIFFSETEPTGTITEGSYWISTSATKIFSRTANLFDYITMAPKTTEYTGKYLNSTGETVNSAEWQITDFIPCDGTEFTINPIGGNTPAICLYDANKDFITGKSYNTGGISTEIPVTITSETTAKYIRFSYHTTVPSSIMLNVGSTAATFEPYLKWQ